MRAITIYGLLFLVGTTYLMAWGPEMGRIFGLEAKRAWIPATVAWGITLALIAGRRRPEAKALPQGPRSPTSITLLASLPILGLLGCLVGAAVEWELVAKSQGQWPLALLWSAAAAAAIGLAPNRRTTVVTALRVLLGLSVIAAVAQWSLAGLTVASAIGAALLLVDRLWPKDASSAGPKAKGDEVTASGDSVPGQRKH